MIGQLEQFSIYDLWGEKKVNLKFSDNKLILVGENGSGKTTILRIVYETLACKWAMLSVEDFAKIELTFSKGKPITIYKTKIQAAKELFVDLDSPILRELPAVVRRSLIERSNISGRDVSYDQIIDTLSEYDFTDRELTLRLKGKMDNIETRALSEYSNSIKERLGCSVIYLPTYRRVEKRIGYVNERDY
ncbi:MAG: ATP-binding cassette domain-containing protein, partial [Oscillospiraceae bacterium]